MQRAQGGINAWKAAMCVCVCGGECKQMFWSDDKSNHEYRKRCSFIPAGVVIQQTSVFKRDFDSSLTSSLHAGPGRTPSWAFNQDEWIACRKVPPTPNNPLHSAPTYRLLHWFHLAATWALVIYTHSRHHLVRLHYMLWRCNCKTIICLKSWLQN